MSGHSKWHSIKHKKGKEDARRGKVFTKIMREITVAARLGGGIVEMNPRLRLAIAKGKENNLPNDNIERAIKKGTGELPGSSYDSIIYEGYGPSGVAMIIDVLTDNKNRIVAEVRHLLSKYKGNLGENGCVNWMFDKKGLIIIDGKNHDEDEILEIALEAGAEDMKIDNNNFEIFTEPNDFEDVKKSIEDQKIEINSAEVTMIPQNTVKLKGKDVERMLKLMDALDDLDDVQNIYANFDISQEEIDNLF